METPNWIHPRSPREMMCGWVHLPRFVDKLRLHLAGRLHSDYHENLTKGFDGRWLAAAGVDAARFTEVVHRSMTDGEVADWVREHVRVGAEAKEAFNRTLLHYPPPDDPPGQERLRWRKAQCGLGDRDDIRCMFDLIDADEGRL